MLLHLTVGDRGADVTPPVRNGGHRDQDSQAAAAGNAGRNWDTPAAEALEPLHLAEWVSGSGVDRQLAAACLESLKGREVMEALLGARLAAMGGHGTQYATAPVARLLRTLEPVAEGGWWCSGLDPLADWAPMAWGCFKADRPRLDAEGKAIKYEAPHAEATRSLWLPVPAVVAQRIAQRFGMPLPLQVEEDADGKAGAFWHWWATEPRLPLVITEGAKKAGALLTAGVPAVALSGIWNGCPRDGGKDASGRKQGQHRLIPDLAGVPLDGRPVRVLFDHDTKPETRRNVAKALGTLGRLLARAGAEVLVGTCPGPAKGADDHLLAGGTWEQLEAALRPVVTQPALPAWPKPTITAAKGFYLSEAAPIPAPAAARLVVLQAAMGCGKTESIARAVDAAKAIGRPVLAVFHREGLGRNFAQEHGLPYGSDCIDGRGPGLVLCGDSLCPSSALRIDSRDWEGCLLVIDEAEAGFDHLINGTGTAIAKRRPEVLETLTQIAKGAGQLIASDAQISRATVKALETLTGGTAYVIGSDHRPADGRDLIVAPTLDNWRAALVRHLRAHKKLWITTTAAKPEAANSAQNLAALAQRYWPEARILRVDAETVGTMGHPAAALVEAPNGVAAGFDVVIVSPALAAGLSVTLPDHFDAVFAYSGGLTDPATVVQSMARVRAGCPRYLWAPERSPGSGLRVGSGDTDPAALVKHLDEAEGAIAAQLLRCGGWSPETGQAGPWLALWAEMAALRNRQRHAYRATVVALLEREGYAPRQADELTEESTEVALQAKADLEAIKTTAVAAADDVVINAPAITPAEAKDLARRRRLSPDDRAKLQRYQVSQAWGLQEARPSPGLLDAERKGERARLRFGWLVSSDDARRLAEKADQVTARALSFGGRVFAPDLCRETEGNRLAAAEALGLAGWLERCDSGEWFDAEDPALVKLQAIAEAHRSGLRQVLEISPCRTAIATLRALLRLAGCRIESKRQRSGRGREASADYRYRVVRDRLPPGVTWAGLTETWTQELVTRAGGCVPGFPLHKEGGAPGTRKPGTHPEPVGPSDRGAVQALEPLPLGTSAELVTRLVPRLLELRRRLPRATSGGLARALSATGQAATAESIAEVLVYVDGWIAEEALLAESSPPVALVAEAGR